MKFILLVLAFVMPLLPQSIDATKLGGLRFSGNYAKSTPTAPIPALLPVSKRSVFETPAEEKIGPGPGYSISFNLSIWDNRFPGQVFKVAGDRYSIAFQYSIDDKRRESNLLLLINGKPSGIRFTINQDRVYEDKWFPVVLKVDGESGVVSLSFADLEMRGRIPRVTGDGISLRFGRDISGNCLAMEIKDLKIRSGSGLLHHWLFTEMSGDIAYDNEGNLDLKVVNCEWLINRHFHWEFIRPVVYREPGTYQHTGTDPEFLDIDAVRTRIINLRNRTYTVVQHINNPRINGLSRGLIENDSLIAFQTGYPDHPAVLNFRTGYWPLPGDKFTPEGHVYAPALILDPRSLEVFIFGGYGWYKFKNNLLKFNKETRVWDTLKTSGEKPNPVQYPSVLKGKNEGEYWITGGIGNESGDQADGYYPQWGLFRFDLKTLIWQKKWEWQDTSGRNLEMQSVWADPGMTNIYGMTKLGIKDTHIFELIRLTLDNRAVTVVGERVPIEMVNFYAPELFIDHQTGMLYIYSPVKGSKDSLFLFGSIRTPVLTREEYHELLESSTPMQIAKRQRVVAYLLIGMVSISIPAVVWAGYRRRSRNRAGMRDLEKSLAPSRNYLTLFGGLKMVNAEGVNIHEKLTPGLAELFALIYLRTVATGGKGITLDECARLHWTWIEEENINNNRKVTFLKLRRALQEYSTIKLDQKDDTVMIVIPESCDDEMRVLFGILDSKAPLPGKHKLERFMQIISRGELLAGITSEWASNERNNIVSRILQRASGMMKELRDQGDHAKALEVAMAASTQDPLSEEILKHRIVSLLAIGEEDAAKRVYSRFARDYSIRYGEEYPYDMDEFTGN